MLKNETLKDFYLLAEYLKKNGKVRDLDRYKRDFSAFLLHADHLKAYDFAAPYCKNKKILDIGCFIGYGEKCIALYAKEIIAIDNDDTALEFACQNNLVPNVKFQKVDARKVPFSEESFDIVLAFHLIEHIHPDEVYSFLHEVRRVLRKDGLLFMTTPNRKFRLRAFQHPFNPEHYHEFTANGLLKVLKTTFREIEIMGVRAKKWIEEIERRRVKKSAYRVYIREPLSKFLNAVFPEKIKNLLKKIKSRIAKSSESEIIISANNEQFSNLFQKFSMNNYYLEKQKNLVDKSLDLVAICKK